MDNLQFVAKLGIATLVASTILVGCKTTPKVLTQKVDYQHQAASFNMAVTMVARWDKYAKVLSPGFSLKGDDALNKVIPKTSSIQELNISRSGTSIKFGLPRRSETKTKTDTVTDGVETSSSTKERKVEPGTLPESSATLPDSQTTFQAAGSDGLSKSEPLLEYAGATALFQEVQILNRYVSDAALRHGYTPYIVRLQIGVQPYQRRLPYDVYMTLGLFPKWRCIPGDGNDCSQLDTRYSSPALTIPLLVTDSLESSLASRTNELTKQLGFAIDFLGSNVIGGISRNRLNSELDSFAGIDLNSTFTIGRISEGTLQLRLGALRIGQDAHVMIPRNHHVTMLVMVPNEAIKPPNKMKNGKEIDYSRKKGATTVSVRAYTELRHSGNGENLSQRSRSKEFESLANSVMPRYVSNNSISTDSEICTELFDLPKRDADDNECGLPKVPSESSVLSTKSILLNTTDAKQKRCVLSTVENLQCHVLNNDFESFLNFAKRVGIEEKRRELWLLFAEELGRREFIGANFELPRLVQAALPPGGTNRLITNDGKILKVQLTGGSGLEAAQLTATLSIGHTSKNTSEKTYQFAATAVSTSNGGQTVNAVFPSPDTMGLADWVPKTLELRYKNNKYEYSSLDIQPMTVQDLTLTKIAAAKPKPSYSIRLPVSTINADKDANGKIVVFLEAKKVNGVLPIDIAAIEVSNAVVTDVAAQDENGANLTKPLVKLGKIIAVPNSQIRIDLGNLVPGTKVKITAVGQKIDSDKKKMENVKPAPTPMYLDVIE